MERYQSLVPKYSKGASAAIIVFDVTCEKSYTSAKELLAEAPNSCDSLLVTYFVGNKTDGKAVIDLHEAWKFADEHKAPFMEVSAKTGENVIELFVSVAERLATADSPEQGITIGEPGQRDGATAGDQCC
jgi:GTPase SAR1 family protein